MSKKKSNILFAVTKPIKKWIQQQYSKLKTNKTLYSAVCISAKQHRIDLKKISKNALRVTEVLQKAGYQAFIVGGAVRDLILNIVPKDFDVATNATPEQVKKLFPRALLIGRRFQIVHVRFGKEIIEVSTFRGSSDGLPANILPSLEETDEIETALEETFSNESQGKNNEQASNNPYLLDCLSGPKKNTFVSKYTNTRHKTDRLGRVLRDNIWGEQHEDAIRRDLTINAMYYDPAKEIVYDYHNGISDTQQSIIKIIGDPTQRYREDPVRMLRVIRFSSKLGFKIDADTRTPIANLRHLIANVPPARLFDETLKLLFGGQAAATIAQLQAENLIQNLLPLLPGKTDVAGQHFLQIFFRNTDKRVNSGRSVSPGFTFAALLWPSVQYHWAQLPNELKHSIEAKQNIVNQVINKQCQTLFIPKRFIGDIKEIWLLQSRLEKRLPRNVLQLLEHPRFRAAYDFLLLRSETGEFDSHISDWWTQFVESQPDEKQLLISQLLVNSGANSSRRRRKKATITEPISEKNTP